MYVACNKVSHLLNAIKEGENDLQHLGLKVEYVVGKSDSVPKATEDLTVRSIQVHKCPWQVRLIQVQTQNFSQAVYNILDHYNLKNQRRKEYNYHHQHPHQNPHLT